MKTEKLIDELLHLYKSAEDKENKAEIRKAIKYIDSNFFEELNEHDLKIISAKFKNNDSIKEAIKKADTLSIKKIYLIDEIKKSFQGKKGKQKKEIIDWVKKNLPDQVTSKEMDILIKKYPDSTEIKNAIDIVMFYLN